MSLAELSALQDGQEAVRLVAKIWPQSLEALLNPLTLPTPYSKSRNPSWAVPGNPVLLCEPSSPPHSRVSATSQG